VTADHEEDSSRTRRPGGSGGLRIAMSVVLGLLLVAAVALGTWGFVNWRSAEKELDARADVARVAEQFTMAVNNYDSGSIDDYQSTVEGLLSTKFKSEFNQAMEDIVAQVQEAKMASEGKVLASGVAAIDNDSARVLVVSDATVKTVFDDRKRHFRWEISLVKVDGEWLVDDFTPVS
jgi:Mce-associated membrane protein